MLVKVFGIEKGMEEYQNVTTVRIKSKDYNLLIFKGYLSIIGEIEGSFDIEFNEKKFSYENIHAYYINSNDVFSIILGSDNNA